ncbi:MAG: alkaline phosphatase family protein [Anaerolineae bacterium]|jgi:hypothetical protein
MPTWFARRVLDVVGRVTDVYYRRKYGAMARRLGRSAVANDEGRGFILLQIDGLSYAHLMQALEAGAMPYVSRLLSSNQLEVAPWRCGLPSSTPAVQAGMMFGNRFDIPGYRWYEKDRGAVMTPQRLDQIPIMVDRISEGKRGILSGGSCYVSLFDGDAEMALFTLSTLRRQRFFESLRGVGLLTLFLLNPGRVLRVFGMAVADYFRSLARRLVALTGPLSKQLGARLRGLPTHPDKELHVVNPLDVFSPLLHAVSDSLFTEVQTFGVMLDIYRCAPAIYANYNGYDEVAHELGPDHRGALRVLRGIDRRIHQIDRMRAHYQKREYDLYLMSDHGNTPSVPFSWQNGSTLGQHLIAEIGEGLSLDERMERHTYVRNRARYLREELRALEENVPRRFRSALAAARRYADQYVSETEGLDYDMKRKKDVVVSASGSLAHIYFNVTQRPLDMIEVLLLYPQLLDRLTTTAGIGAVIGRAGERTIVLGRQGGTLDIGGAPELEEPPNPLAPYGDEDYAACQIHRVAHFPHSGDLIVLGDVQEDGKVITFESQAATHGGLGGPQASPFIAWPPEHNLEPERLNDAEDLYPYFMRYHGRGGPRAPS